MYMAKNMHTYIQTSMFLTTLMTDDRLVADLDYSDAPCPDPDDICSITVTPAEMVALMEEDIEKEEPLPP